MLEVLVGSVHPLVDVSIWVDEVCDFEIYFDVGNTVDAYSKVDEPSRQDYYYACFGCKVLGVGLVEELVSGSCVLILWNWVGLFALEWIRFLLGRQAASSAAENGIKLAAPGA